MITEFGDGDGRRVLPDLTSTPLAADAYEAAEAFAADGYEQGPWTDIYVLGAILYRAVTGAAPLPALLRTAQDNLLPAAQQARSSYRPEFLSAIDWGTVALPGINTMLLSGIFFVLLGALLYSVPFKGKGSGSLERVREVLPSLEDSTKYTRREVLWGDGQGKSGGCAGNLWSGAGRSACAWISDRDGSAPAQDR